MRVVGLVGLQWPAWGWVCMALVGWKAVEEVPGEGMQLGRNEVRTSMVDAAGMTSCQKLPLAVCRLPCSRGRHPAGTCLALTARSPGGWTSAFLAPVCCRDCLGCSCVHTSAWQPLVGNARCALFGSQRPLLPPPPGSRPRPITCCAVCCRRDVCVHVGAPPCGLVLVRDHGAVLRQRYVVPMWSGGTLCHSSACCDCCGAVRDSDAPHMARQHLLAPHRQGAH